MYDNKGTGLAARRFRAVGNKSEGRLDGECRAPLDKVFSLVDVVRIILAVIGRAFGASRVEVEYKIGGLAGVVGE